ncbi:unnamed protein product [Brassica oleracea]
MQRQEVSWCTLWRPARGTTCKGLCISAGRDWAELLETAARAGPTRRNPQEREPAALRDGTGRDNPFDNTTCDLKNSISSIRLWALSGEVLSHDSSPRWFVWYSGVPASQQNLEDTDETCADSRYHFDHGSGSQLNESRFDLCRFLVPRDMTVGHFIHMLSNRLHRTTFRNSDM